MSTICNDSIAERYGTLCNLIEAIWLKKDDQDYFNIDTDNLPKLTSPQARKIAAFIENLFAEDHSTESNVVYDQGLECLTKNSKKNPDWENPETITVIYDYPLHTEVRKTFTSSYGPFSVLEFKDCVMKGYEEIYAAEPEPTQEHRDASNLMNRPDVGGNVWGHDLGDLMIEGWEEVEPNTFRLYMGS